MGTLRYIGRTFVLLLFTATAGMAADRPPNILFILADDVGREVLGCYGGESYATPHIDSLAASGMKFEHCYSMPVCHPSRVCLLTGRYPRMLGNPRWGNFPESENKRTFAALLQKAGYATAVAGKWQLQLLKNNPQHPHQLGFDQYSVFGWHEGPRYHQPMIYQNGTVLEGTKEDYGPDLYVEFLAEFMRQNRARPFFAWYSMALCHDVSDDLKSPPPFYKDQRWMHYREMAESMDDQVGKIVSAVKELGLEENTLILFTTDNGTARSSYLRVRDDGKMVKEKVVSSWRGREIAGGKGTLTDWGTRVPLLASWPGRIPPGQTVSDLVDFADFHPTFLALAGLSLPEWNLNGLSFAPRLRGQQADPRSWVYAESGNGKAFWTRTADFKLYQDGRLFAMDDWGHETGPLDAGALSEAGNKARALLWQAARSLGAELEAPANR